jgi:hypothetical protein
MHASPVPPLESREPLADNNLMNFCRKHSELPMKLKHIADALRHEGET